MASPARDGLIFPFSSNIANRLTKNKGIKKAGTGVPNFQRGWETFVVGPPGLSVKVCLHPWLAAFAYPMDDVVQTSHADVKVKAF